MVKLPELSDKQVNRHGAFIRLGKSKRVELLLTETLKRKHFGDWAQLKQTKDFMECNISAKDHAGQQRQIRQNRPKERFICFVLPPALVKQLGGRRKR